MKLKNSLVLTLTVLAGACIGRVKQPEVTLTSVDVAGIGLKGASLVANLEIKNPNDLGVQTDSIQYQLFANTTSGTSAWAPVLSRTYNVPINLKSGGTTRVQVPVDFDYATLQGPLRAILDRGTFNYRMQGRVFLSQPIKRVLPFDKTGNVSLQGVR